MGSMAKKLAKALKRKAFKSERQIYLNERNLQERLQSEGLPTKTNLIGSNVKMLKKHWEEVYEKAIKLGTGKVVQTADPIDLEWEDEELAEMIKDA